MRPGGAPDRVDQRSAIERRTDRRHLGLDRFEPLRGHDRGEPVRVGRGRTQIDGCRARGLQPRAEPLAIGIARLDRDGVDRGRDAVEVQRLPRTPDGQHLDLGIGQQRRGLAAEGRVAQHDRALDASAQLRVGQQSAVAVDEVAAEPRSAHDLGDQRPSAQMSERLGIGSGVRPGDDHRARSSRQNDGQLVGLGGQIGLADAPSALIERTGCLFFGGLLDRGGVGVDLDRGGQLRGRHAEPARQVAAERFAERQVQVHRSRRTRSRAERRLDRVGRDLAQHETLLAVALGVGRVGHRQVGLEPRARREHAQLPGGLVRPDAPQLRRAIGRQQQQRHAGVVRFERRRQQIRRRRARRAHHDRRHPRLTSDAERCEPRDPLVDAHVQADGSAGLEFGGDQGESLRARSGAQDDVTDAEIDERSEESCRGIGCRRRVTFHHG